VSPRPEELRELYGLREQLRQQFHAGTDDKLAVCFAMVELAQQITDIEAQRSFADVITDHLLND
jgi:hypothetical protein